MYKAYDLVDWHYLQISLYHIKICKHFIQLFGNIHENQVNRVMIDFGLLKDYKIHDKLDQREVFSSLFWKIFNDPLLCKIKKHEHLCGYRINSRFVAKSGRIKISGKKTSFLAAGAFVDDTIWIGSSHASMQYILNIASEFFVINDILININKMVAISINQKIKNASLLINRLPISIAKKEEPHQYLGIFLSTEGFSKLSLAQAHVNINFISLAVYCKWNIMIRKSLKAKANLPRDFLSEVLYYSSLYSLKSFEQVQSEEKLVLLISFFNSHDILGCLFDYKFLNLQVLRWVILDPLQFPVRLHVSSVNNFLAGMVKIFLNNELLLANNLLCAFHRCSNFPMSSILGRKDDELEDILSLKAVESKRPSALLVGTASASGKNVLSVLDFDGFSDVCNSLLEVWSDCIEIYTDESLQYVGSTKVMSEVAVYFLATNTDIGIRIDRFLSSTLTVLQAVVLALKCIPSSCLVVLYSDSQSVIDACTFETSFTMPDFHNQFGIWKRFLVAEGFAVFGNIRHFVQDLYQSICHTCWEAGLSFDIVLDVIIRKIDWKTTAAVWHSDSHMLFGFTSRKSANLCTYLIKAVYRQLLIAIRKRLYKKSYSGVLCLMCNKVKLSDHVFTCSGNSGLHGDILVKATEKWKSMSGFSNLFTSAILLLPSLCFLDVSLYMAICKDFVIKDWYAEAVLVFKGKKKAVLALVKYVRFVVKLHCDKI
ncbi:hypothetical protein G9A89_001794 [Geosiphon pyriformis]|nr:hypothetical protein G9A89_001794 [Geosiphon pyriformis]